jgi:hypothetical protein
MRHDLANSAVCNKLREIHLQPRREPHWNPDKEEGGKLEKRKRADIAVDYFMKRKTQTDMIDVHFVNPRSSSRSIPKKATAMNHLATGVREWQDQEVQRGNL